MAEEQARVLARGTNIAVTHLEGRAFPGVHVQGDTFNVLLEQVTGAAARLRQDAGDQEALEDLEYTVEELTEILRYYESVLAAHDIRLPYVRTAG